MFNCLYTHIFVTIARELGRGKSGQDSLKTANGVDLCFIGDKITSNGKVSSKFVQRWQKTSVRKSLDENHNIRFSISRTETVIKSDVTMEFALIGLTEMNPSVFFCYAYCLV